MIRRDEEGKPLVWKCWLNWSILSIQERQICLHCCLSSKCSSFLSSLSVKEYFNQDFLPNDERRDYFNSHLIISLVFPISFSTVLLSLHFNVKRTKTLSTFQCLRLLVLQERTTHRNLRGRRIFERKNSKIENKKTKKKKQNQKESKRSGRQTDTHSKLVSLSQGFRRRIRKRQRQRNKYARNAVHRVFFDAVLSSSSLHEGLNSKALFCILENPFLLVSLVYLHIQSSLFRSPTFFFFLETRDGSIDSSSHVSCVLDVYTNSCFEVEREWNEEESGICARFCFFAWQTCNSSVFFAYIFSLLEGSKMEKNCILCMSCRVSLSKSLASTVQGCVPSNSLCQQCFLSLFFPMFFFQAVYVSDWVCMSFDSTAMPFKVNTHSTERLQVKISLHSRGRKQGKNLRKFTQNRTRQYRIRWEESSRRLEVIEGIAVAANGGSEMHPR